MIFNHLSNILAHHDYNGAENRNLEQTLRPKLHLRLVMDFSSHLCMRIFMCCASCCYLPRW